MTDEEHQALVAQIQSGALLLGLDRSIARRFYTELPISRIQAETGETPYVEKFVVLGAQMAGYWILPISFIFAVLAFHWWAALAIPASLLIFVLFTARASMPGAGMGGVSVLLGLAGLCFYLGVYPSEYAGWHSLLVALSLWCSRLPYVAAPKFLRTFVVRNRRAYEILGSNVHIREADSDC